MKHSLKRSLALVMALVMIVGLLPVLNAFAAEEITASLSFADTANRTASSTTQQVWEQNGIIFTYDKAGYNNNLAEYANPIRLYAGTTATIAYPSITKIVFTASESKYVTPLVTSLTNAYANAEVTSNGTAVTIILSDVSDSVVFSMSAQIRVNDLTVYAQAAGTEVHVHTPGEAVIENNVPATCGVAGSYDTVVYCTDESCGKVVSRETTVIEALEHNYVDGVCANCGEAEPSGDDIPSATVTTVIGDYATAQSWKDATQYSTINMDEYITVTATGKTNTGKYYNNGNNWRIYQNESPAIVISGNYEGLVITSVKITYSKSNTGILTLNGVNVDTNEVVPVSANSVTFSVGNTGTASNGQVRITAIEVTYCDATEAPTCEHTNYTIEGAADATCVADGHTGNKVCSDCGVTFESGSSIPATGHNFVDGVCTNCSFAFTKPEAVEPAAGDSFNAVVYQLNVPAKLYFTGAMSGNYLATTENAEEAAIVYSEIVDGGFKLYIMDGEVKKYINIYEYTTGKVGVQLNETDGCVFTMNTAYNTPVTVVLETEYYLGCYQGFTTFSASKLSYISDSNVDVSQFPMRLVKLEVEEPDPSEPVETEPTVPSEPEPTEPTPSEPNVDETLSFYNVGLVLGADIRGVFQIKYKPATSPYTSFKVMIERNGVESELALTTSSGTSTVYLGYALNLSAKEMADEVTATIIGVTADGTEYISNAYTWSIKQGAMAMLDERADLGTEAANKQMVLIANMLHYGAKAQENFQHNLENLATDGLKAEYAALILNTTPEMSGFEKPDETGFTVKMTGTGLNLASKVEVLPQFYLPKDPVYSDYKAVVTQTHTKADGSEVTETFEFAGEECLTAGRYLAPYINDLAAAELRDTLTITLYKGDEAVSATYTFSAESACSGMLNSYPDLIPALMNYADCAYAVFG